MGPSEGTVEQAATVSIAAVAAAASTVRKSVRVRKVNVPLSIATAWGVSTSRP